MSRVIVLGLNRSGTKLASCLIANAAGFRRLCFEPFSWEGGVDRSDPADIQNQLRRRRPSDSGRSEHLRLPIVCDGDEGSTWLSNVLRAEAWDLVKFVEIGRCRLYRSLCPDALMVGLIRSPAAHLASLNGSTVQKSAVIEQWRRARIESSLPDPLPDAGRWLPEDLADCARGYHFFYTLLLANLAEHAAFVCYDDLIGKQLWHEKISRYLTLGPRGPEPPMIGVSTKKALSDDQVHYIDDRLRPVYAAFSARG